MDKTYWKPQLLEGTRKWIKARRYWKRVDSCTKWIALGTLPFIFNLQLSAWEQAPNCGLGRWIKPVEYCILLAWRTKRRNPGQPKLLESEEKILKRKESEGKIPKFCFQALPKSLNDLWIMCAQETDFLKKINTLQRNITESRVSITYFS